MVTFPENDYARVSSVKTFFGAGAVPSEREFEAFLRTAGLSRKQAKGVISQGYKTLLPAAEGDDSVAIRNLSARIRQATEEIETGFGF